MNRILKRRLSVVAAASSLGILSPVWGPMLLRELPIFGVEELRVSGTQFVEDEAVRGLAALPPDASVWDNMRSAELGVTQHPLVAEATIRRSGLHRLDIEIREVKPIVLAATPRLVPVDASGRSVPVEPAAHDLDLPVLLGSDMSEDGRIEPEAARR
ncbi:MAG: FtsQ-type POTRA domain-containing protein, partial [Gemmatimonadota bacterium]|nr:FtsQ-type POTRA domain-containing protein [Gemmatimonadota bacterium]